MFNILVGGPRPQRRLLGKKGRRYISGETWAAVGPRDVRVNQSIWPAVYWETGKLVIKRVFRIEEINKNKKYLYLAEF